MVYVGSPVYNYDPYIAHYGIKGMKWGVRRYQNYDGTLTQQGLARYRKNMGLYEQAREQRKSTFRDKNSTLKEKWESMRNVSGAKKEVKRSYKDLKDYNKFEEGKRLAQSGKRIPSRKAIVMGSVAAERTIHRIASGVGQRIAGVSGTRSSSSGTKHLTGNVTGGLSTIGKGLTTRSSAGGLGNLRNRRGLGLAAATSIYVGGNVVNSIVSNKLMKERKQLDFYNKNKGKAKYRT